MKLTLLLLAFSPLVLSAAPKILRNLPYATSGHERQTLDLHLPESADGPVPLLIWIHGGGWQSGSKENALPLRQGWTERGYAVASLNYRFSWQAVFPAPIEDCKSAIRWLRANAEEYGIDPERFGVWGSSAGGHLAALLGTSGDAGGFDAGDHLDQSSRVQAVCDYYGPTDFIAFVATPGYGNHGTADAPEAKLLGGPVMEKQELAARANPITFASGDDPPFLIVHGDNDPIVPINQSKLLFEALKREGGSPHFHTIKGAAHGRGFNGPEILPMVKAFFDSHLLAGTAPAVQEAKTSESDASAEGVRAPGAPGVPPSGSPAGPGKGTIPSFEEILSRTDKDRDGKLTSDEFRGPPAMFGRLDSNGDGFVTPEEHAKAFPGPATP